MQGRRRLEEDLALRQSLGRHVDDLSVLIEWANAGEDVSADLARGLGELRAEVEAAETKKMLGGQYDRANAPAGRGSDLPDDGSARRPSR